MRVEWMVRGLSSFWALCCVIALGSRRLKAAAVNLEELRRRLYAWKVLLGKSKIRRCARPGGRCGTGCLVGCVFALRVRSLGLYGPCSSRRGVEGHPQSLGVDGYPQSKDHLA